MSELFQPYDPDRDVARKRRFKPIPFRIVAPNLVTLLALCLGLTAMRLTVEGKIEIGIYCIVAAAALDGIDGRLARLLKGTSRFGEQLDSLADFVNFGVAPAFILYHAQLTDLKSFGWICVMIYAIATGLRLARFNVMLDDPNRPVWKKNYFTGVPSPLGALLVMLPLYLEFLGLQAVQKVPLLVALYAVIVGLLMVSNIPIYAAKTLGVTIPRTAVLPIFVAVVAFVAALVAHTFEVLTACCFVYLAMMPWSMRRYRMLEQADEAAADSRRREASAAPAGPAAPPPGPAG